MSGIHIRRNFPFDDATACGQYRHYHRWFDKGRPIHGPDGRLGPRDWLWDFEWEKHKHPHMCAACIEAMHAVYMEELAEVEL